MKRGCLWILLLVAAGVCLLFVASSVPKNYRLDAYDYSVPSNHDFTRSYTCGILVWFGCPGDEPTDSLWLIFPASEVARDVPGYRAITSGYVPGVSVDLVVHISGGAKARNFAADYSRLWKMVDQERERGAFIKTDAIAGWSRVIWRDGDKGTPAEGHSGFYLIPHGGQSALPLDWAPPSCRGTADQNRQEYFSCQYLIKYRARTFDFTLQDENLELAGQIPSYVNRRLEQWRTVK